jgi:hypothetical protein
VVNKWLIFAAPAQKIVFYQAVGLGAASAATGGFVCGV